MQVSDYIEYVAAEGDRFANAAEKGSLAVDIVGCDDWDMRDLVRHLGVIHLWAAANMAFPADQFLIVDEFEVLTEYWPELASSWPEDSELVTWYRQTLDNLVRVFKEAPSDLECFAFLPAPTPLTMWSRRQASEIAIHRFDAEAARGIESHFEPAFAADMLDELVAGFAPGEREIDVESDRVIHIHADDVDEHWYLTIGPKGVTTAREGDRSDVTITGTAAALYLLFWNRTDSSTVTVNGDADLLNLWSRICRVQWSGV